MKIKNFILVFLAFCLLACEAGLPPQRKNSVTEAIITILPMLETEKILVPTEESLFGRSDLSGPINASGAEGYIIGKKGIIRYVGGYGLRLYSDQKGNLYGHYWTTDQDPFFILSPDSVKKGVASPLIVPEVSGSLRQIGFIARAKGIWFFLLLIH